MDPLRPRGPLSPASSLALVLLATALAAPPGAAQGLQPRIVNGVFEFGEPATGALLFGTTPETAALACTGTLIGCETFLTAAHCVCETDGPDCTGPRPPDPGSYHVYLQHAGFFEVASIALRSDYFFPVADVAVLKLGQPVEGVTPASLNTLQTPPTGSAGRIVGFGRSGGSGEDYGLKRSGNVVTATCTGGVSNVTSVCWNFSNPVGPPGEDSGTCNGDSGGPLFIDLGAGPSLAGVTSGGDSASCLAPDASFDANVFFYRSWIAAEAGPDLGASRCGGIAQVGEEEVSVEGETGSLSASVSEARSVFAVPGGSEVLRLAMNSSDDGFADFDLYVKRGTPPSAVDFDCAQNGLGQFGFCEFVAPAPGDWHVLIDRFSGAGTYQLAATRFSTPCSQPGSEGLPCDDRNDCTGLDRCQSGTCLGDPVTDGVACDDGDPCSPGDQCAAGACVSGPAPVPVCRRSQTPGGAVLSLVDRPRDSGDRLAWRWARGEATSAADFGDPTANAELALCVYDEVAGVPSRVYELRMPAGSGWRPLSQGFRYADKTRSRAGLRKVVLRPGEDGRARIIVNAGGPALALPSLPLAQEGAVRVQLVGENTCWEATYRGALRNDAVRFKARSD